jgi:hypothetical protein
VHYYGLSTDRLYPLVFMLWLGVVLGWLSLTVLRGWNRPFLAGVAVSAFATLVGLNISSPERIVATSNVERATTTRARDSLDVRYLASLGGEATDIAVKAALATSWSSTTIEQRRMGCYAVRNLLNRWGPTSPNFVDATSTASWRTWNLGKTNGLTAVRHNLARLESIRRDECATVLATSTQPASTQR